MDTFDRPCQFEKGGQGRLPRCQMHDRLAVWGPPVNLFDFNGLRRFWRARLPNCQIANGPVREAAFPKAQGKLPNLKRDGSQKVWSAQRRSRSPPEQQTACGREGPWTQRPAARIAGREQMRVQKTSGTNSRQSPTWGLMRQVKDADSGAKDRPKCESLLKAVRPVEDGVRRIVLSFSPRRVKPHLSFLGLGDRQTELVVDISFLWIVDH